MTDAVQTTVEPSAAERLWPTTAKAEAPAPAAAAAPSNESLAAALYDAPTAADSDVLSQVSEWVDRGQVEPGQAQAVAAGLTKELRAVGAHGADGRGLFRDMNAPALAGRAGELARGEANRELHRQFGDKAPELLRATDAWLKATAPTIHAALGKSKAGSDVAHVAALIKAYQRGARRG